MCYLKKNRKKRQTEKQTINYMIWMPPQKLTQIFDIVATLTLTPMTFKSSSNLGIEYLCSKSFKLFRRYGFPNFLTSHLVATLTLNTRPSKSNQFMASTTPSCKQSFRDARLQDARTHSRTRNPKT